MGDSFSYKGALTYSSAKRAAAAREAFEALIGEGRLTPRSVTWAHRSAEMSWLYAGTFSQGAADLYAVIALAKPASAGFIDVYVMGQGAVERVEAGGRSRSLRPDLAPAAEGPLLARPRHPARIHAADAAAGLLALGGGVTGYGPRNNDADVTVWDLERGLQLHRLAGLKRQITAVALSPDGRYVAAGSATGSVRVWPLGGGRSRAKKLGRGPVRSIHFAPDGERLAALLPRAGLFELPLDLKAGAIAQIGQSPPSAFCWAGEPAALLYVSHGAVWDARDLSCVRELPRGFYAHILRARGDRVLALSPHRMLSWRRGAPEPPAALSREALSPEAPCASDVLLSGAVLEDRVLFASQRHAGWWSPEDGRLGVDTWETTPRAVLLQPDAIAAATGGSFSTVVEPDLVPASGRAPRQRGASTPPRASAPQAPSRWAQKVAQWERDGVPPCERPVADWQWGRAGWGHHGVHTFEGQLVWYTHSNNPHGGGGAAVQHFEAFLEHGPRVNGAPDATLLQVYAAVLALIDRGRGA